MKQRHLISLLQNDYVTVQVVFQRPENAAPTPSTNRRYTYKARMPISKDDIAIVEACGRLAIVKVVEVNDVPQIDMDADYDYKWIVQRIDRSAYDATVAVEKKFAAAMLAAEKLHQREVLAKKFTEHLPVGSEARNLFEQAVAEVQQVTSTIIEGVVGEAKPS